MMDCEPETIQREILTRLRSVIDPETQADVVRMHLVEELSVEANGDVSYVFRPSSPFCPLAVYLVQQIKHAVAEVPGVNKQQISVRDYIAAEDLTNLINKETET